MSDRLRLLPVSEKLRLLCAVEDCVGSVRARGWCNKHWTRWYKHGDPLADHRQKWAGVVCRVEGCDNPVDSQGWCQKHYTRWRRHGDPLVAYPGARFVASNGYRRVQGNAQRYEHRRVLLEKIGPGTHPCHWCAVPVTWGVDLVTDHLDDDRLNNAPDNLVPACQSCNTRRALAKRYGNPWPLVRGVLV